MTESNRKEHPEKIDFSLFKNEYFSESLEGFQRFNDILITLEKDPTQTVLLSELFRVLHTLKGSSYMLGFIDIGNLAHQSENMLTLMRNGVINTNDASISLLFRTIDALESLVRCRIQGSNEISDNTELSTKIKTLCESHTIDVIKEISTEKTTWVPAIEKIQSVKVQVGELDALFDQIGEMVIAKNRLDTLLDGMMNNDLKKILTEMDRLIRGLQESIYTIRLLPISEIFQKFPRMVHDLARAEGKEIDLIIEGGDIELDKAILDSISEPIIHLLRNAVGHGIEAQAERISLQKPPIGTIHLGARRTENHVLISVADDGYGINVQHLKDLAISRGLRSPKEILDLPDKDAIEIIFEAGYSSSNEVSELEGRGMGLDIVKTSATKLGGVVEVSTQVGQGSCFTLRLPQVVAVMQTLMVKVGDYIYAIPSDIVIETVNLTSQDFKAIGHEPVLMFRDEVIPFVHLGKLLGDSHSDIHENIVAIILKTGGKLIAIGVESLIDIMENIIKPVDPIAKQFLGFTGGAILGNGKVALVLNIPTLLNLKAKQKRQVHNGTI